MEKLVHNKSFQTFLKKLGFKENYGSYSHDPKDLGFDKEYGHEVGIPNGLISIYQNWEGKDIALNFVPPTEESFDLETISVEDIEKRNKAVDVIMDKMRTDMTKIIKKARELQSPAVKYDFVEYHAEVQEDGRLKVYGKNSTGSEMVLGYTRPVSDFTSEDTKQILCAAVINNFLVEHNVERDN